MASFHCYNNSDVIATLITTNFHLYLIQLWWQIFQMFVCGDVVYAQTWQVLTLKNCMEPFSYASTAYLVASALVSVRLFCKNLGNLQKFFWANGLPPPLAKNSPYAYVGNDDQTDQTLLASLRYAKSNKFSGLSYYNSHLIGHNSFLKREIIYRPVVSEPTDRYNHGKYMSMIKL